MDHGETKASWGENVTAMLSEVTTIVSRSGYDPVVLIDNARRFPHQCSCTLLDRHTRNTLG